MGVDAGFDRHRDGIWNPSMWGSEVASGKVPTWLFTRLILLEICLSARVADHVT
jgi:hypothetical protein